MFYPLIPSTENHPGSRDPPPKEPSTRKQHQEPLRCVVGVVVAGEHDLRVVPTALDAEPGDAGPLLGSQAGVLGPGRDGVAGAPGGGQAAATVSQVRGEAPDPSASTVILASGSRSDTSPAYSGVAAAPALRPAATTSVAPGNVMARWSRAAVPLTSPWSRTRSDGLDRHEQKGPRHEGRRRHAATSLPGRMRALLLVTGARPGPTSGWATWPASR
jgi:hypothetical protein